MISTDSGLSQREKVSSVSGGKKVDSTDKSL